MLRARYSCAESPAPSLRRGVCRQLSEIARKRCASPERLRKSQADNTCGDEESEIGALDDEETTKGAIHKISIPRRSPDWTEWCSEDTHLNSSDDEPEEGAIHNRCKHSEEPAKVADSDPPVEKVIEVFHSDIEIHPPLAKLGIYFHKALKVFLCCFRAWTPSTFVSHHLPRDHGPRSSVHLATSTANAYLDENPSAKKGFDGAKQPLPRKHSPQLPVLPVTEGFVCSRCEYSSPLEATVQQHLRTAHGERRATLGEHYHPSAVQRLHGKSAYFAVSSAPAPPPTEIQALANHLAKLAAEISAHVKADPAMPDNHREVDTLHHFMGLDSDAYRKVRDDPKRLNRLYDFTLVSDDASRGRAVELDLKLLIDGLESVARAAPCDALYALEEEMEGPGAKAAR